MTRICLLLAAALLWCSHDLFLKSDSYFLPPDTEVVLRLFNGSYDNSENTVARDRMVDVSVVSGGRRTRLDTTQWSDRETETQLRLSTGAAGTYVVGVSTRARNIELSAEKFNAYLEHDGLPDVLAQRERDGTLDQAAVESYAKHVKTLLQVGERRSDDWQTVLGYPVEFVPQANPYALSPGEELTVRLLANGRALADQAVYLGAPDAHTHGHAHDHDGGHSHDAEDGHTHATTTALRTDADGRVRFSVPTAGAYYLRTIRMTAADTPGLTHVSNWATLTFAVGDAGVAAHSHDHADHSHDHGHASEGSHTHADGTTHSHDGAHSHGVPAYAYWVGSLLFIGALFVYFNRRS